MGTSMKCSRCGSNDFITNNIFVAGETEQVLKCRFCGKIIK